MNPEFLTRNQQVFTQTQKIETHQQVHHYGFLNNVQTNNNYLDPALNFQNFQNVQNVQQSNFQNKVQNNVFRQSNNQLNQSASNFMFQNNNQLNFEELHPAYMPWSSHDFIELNNAVIKGMHHLNAADQQEIYKKYEDIFRLFAIHSSNPTSQTNGLNFECIPNNPPVQPNHQKIITLNPNLTRNVDNACSSINHQKQDSNSPELSIED